MPHACLFGEIQISELSGKTALQWSESMGTDVSSEQTCPMIERQTDLHAGVAEWQTQRT